MSWFEGQGSPSSKKEYVECLGPGPHVTKNGSRWLVVGLHAYTEIQDGTVRCKSCAERTKTWLPRENRPVGHLYLTEEEKTLLRERLAEGRRTFETLEAKTLTKIDNDRTRKPTSRQREL